MKNVGNGMFIAAIAICLLMLGGVLIKDAIKTEFKHCAEQNISAEVCIKLNGLSD